MKTSRRTREVLESDPNTSYNEALLILSVWRGQGFKPTKRMLQLIQAQKLDLPSTILREKARFISRRKQGGTP
jgi:hypothetical protein